MSFLIPENTKFQGSHWKEVSLLNAETCRRSGDVEWEKFYREFSASIKDDDLMTSDEYQTTYGDKIPRP